MPTYPEVGTILSGGTTQLEPIVTGVKTVLTEFTPYLIYITIGLVIASLGFLGVKWLMRYMSGKATGLFSSKRRRR